MFRMNKILLVLVFNLVVMLVAMPSAIAFLLPVQPSLPRRPEIAVNHAWVSRDAFVSKPGFHRPGRTITFRPSTRLSNNYSEGPSSSSWSTSSGSIVTESDFQGAGTLRPDLPPQELPSLLFTALTLNDFPSTDAGLHAMWEFASPTTKHIFHHNVTDFIKSAHDTAEEFPTSFYILGEKRGVSLSYLSLSPVGFGLCNVWLGGFSGCAFSGKAWEMETELNLVGAPQAVNVGHKDDELSPKAGQRHDDCWIATQVMKTISSDGRIRRWQWELRKYRRPPYQGCWYVESVGSSDRNGQFEAQ